MVSASLLALTKSLDLSDLMGDKGLALYMQQNMIAERTALLQTAGWR